MPSKTQSIFLGGMVAAVVGAIVSLVPVAGGCLGCLAYVLAGLVAVWHYTDTHTLTISGGSGAGMGAGAGVVAALLAFLITLLLQVLGIVPSFSEGLEQAIASGQIPPEQAQMVEGFISSPFFSIGIAVFLIIIGAIMGTIGGAIGASVFKRGGDRPDGGNGGEPVPRPQGPAPSPEERSTTPGRTTTEPATGPRER